MALILFLGLHGAQIGFLHFFQRRFGFFKNDVIARFLINRRADYCVYPSTSSPETFSRFGARWLEPKAGVETRGRSHGEADVSLLLSLFLLDEAGWTDTLNQYSFIPPSALSLMLPLKAPSFILSFFHYLLDRWCHFSRHLQQYFLLCRWLC